MNRRLLPPALLVGAALCAALYAACSKDEGPVTPAPDPPVVGGVDKTVVSPGDTLVISGSNFASPASANTVTFSNPLGTSKAFDGSATSLSVVVDQDATTGPIKVSNAGGSDSGPSVEVARNLGDFFVFGGLGPNNVLALPNPTASTRYLVIPHATSPGVSYGDTLGYSIETESSIPATAVAAESRRLTADSRGAGLDLMLEIPRWEQAEEMIAREGVPRMPARSRVILSAAAPDTRQFYVLNTVTGKINNPSNFDRITARLRYDGSRCLIYADIDTLLGGAASGNFNDADFQVMGEAFDNSIDSTNVHYFGSYSDIDGNGRVIILITPVVNRLTPQKKPGDSGVYSGFFLWIDLYSPPAAPSGTTNQAEIFYMLVSDPDGTLSQNGWLFPKVKTLDANISTTAHEHEHMISFSHRLFNEGGVLQQTWLEEGMAHMAEDVNGFDSANQGRTAIYLGNPGAISLENSAAPLNQRGGIYLFLRLMADRYGDGILKDIVQSRCAGRACLQDVTKKDFYDLFAEFLAALYLSGRGITADPRFNYTSINVDDFGTLVPIVQAAGGGLAHGRIRRTAGDFYIFTGALGADSRFDFTDSTKTARLRNVIVRVQ